MENNKDNTETLHLDHQLISPFTLTLTSIKSGNERKVWKEASGTGMLMYLIYLLFSPY